MNGSRRPKVVHMTSVHDANDTRITQKECATLASEGFDVALVAPGTSASLPTGVRHRSVQAPRNRFERFTKTMFDVYRAAREERADIYHFHDPELIAAGLALRLRGARVVFDVHEDVPRDIETKPWLPGPLRPIASAVATVVLRGAQRCFDGIVSATPSIARAFDHPRSIVVRNYPRLEELISGEQRAAFETRPKIAIYLGSIGVLRGVEQSVTAMADPRMPPDARLLLAGGFESETLRAHMESIPGWERVEAIGKVARSAIPSLLARAQMGLVVFQPAPNHDYAMPTKFFEYMAAGLPVIASSLLREYREIVERYECGILVDARDSQEIASAMCRLFENPAEARAMGERGRHAVFGRYEWASEARNLVAFYREMTA
ncbi:MAG: glycosyltransferase family 4 protein [Candidatus Eremiobacteraeota bacterium]|nr:glycosyltransferase family 4 protein [Candidatus Eremiobacteraeota bacterium]